MPALWRVSLSQEMSTDSCNCPRPGALAGDFLFLVVSTRSKALIQCLTILGRAFASARGVVTTWLNSDRSPGRSRSNSLAQYYRSLDMPFSLQGAYTISPMRSTSHRAAASRFGDRRNAPASASRGSCALRCRASLAARAFLRFVSRNGTSREHPARRNKRRNSRWEM